MIVARFIVNAVVLAIELAAIAGAAWLGWRHPFAFAGMSAALAFVLGLALERARLLHEMPFYLGRVPARASLVALALGLAQALGKAALAALVALLTFAGTDAQRLMWVAILFGAVVFAGSSVLRWLSNTFGALASRWGYFRLAVPLGIVFSLVLVLLPSPTFTDVGWKILFDLPAKPSVEQGSEVLFVLKQKFDDLVAGLLAHALPEPWARMAGALLSPNVMTGFLAAIYAVAIAAVVQWIDQRLP
jgi:hypothetical protein